MTRQQSVYLADKFFLGTELCTLKARYEQRLAKYTGDREAEAAIRRKQETAGENAADLPGFSGERSGGRPEEKSAGRNGKTKFGERENGGITEGKFTVVNNALITVIYLNK